MTHYYDIRGNRQDLPAGLRLHPADQAMLQTPPRKEPAMTLEATDDQTESYAARLELAHLPKVRRAPRIEGFKAGYAAAQAEGTAEPTREQVLAYRQTQLDQVHYSVMAANSAMNGYQDGWQAWQDSTRDN